MATTQQLDVIDPLGMPVTDLGSENDVDAVAHRLYAALRELDASGLDLILAIEPRGQDGLWRAVRDRLGRAANRRVLVDRGDTGV
jgi:L-threonylcarbamoyladenylate synthase